MLKLSLALAAAACAFCGSAAALESPVPTAPLQPAQLHSLVRAMPPLSYYPVFARVRHLEGRMLIEFHLDQYGNTVDARIVQSDADAILRATALRLVQGTHYDVGSFAVDRSTRFTTSVVYCLEHCGRVANYPQSDTSIEIRTDAPPNMT
jgi:TonB family protein